MLPPRSLRISLKGLAWGCATRNRRNRGQAFIPDKLEFEHPAIENLSLKNVTGVLIPKLI